MTIFENDSVMSYQAMLEWVLPMVPCRDIKVSGCNNGFRICIDG